MGGIIELWKVFEFLQSQCQGNDGRDVGFRSINLNVQARFVGTLPKHLQSLLVVWPRSANPNGYLIRSQDFAVGLESFDQAGKGSGNVGKVGNTATNNKYFPLFLGIVFPLGHQTDQRLCVFERMLGTGSTRVFSVIGKFVGKSQVGNGIGVDHRGAAPGNLYNPRKQIKRERKIRGIN